MTVAQVIRIMYPEFAINDHLVQWLRVAVTATIRKRARNFGPPARLNFRMNPLSNYTRIFNYDPIERKTPLTCQVNGSPHSKRWRNADLSRMTPNEFLVAAKRTSEINRDNYFIHTYGLYSLRVEFITQYLIYF